MSERKNITSLEKDKKVNECRNDLPKMPRATIPTMYRTKRIQQIISVQLLKKYTEYKINEAKYHLGKVKLE